MCRFAKFQRGIIAHKTPQATFEKESYKVFPMRQQIYGIQTKLKWDNLWTQSSIWWTLSEISNKNNVALWEPLHSLRWTRPTLYHNHKLKRHLQLFNDEQNRIFKANRRWGHKINIHLRCMREALNYLDTIKIHTPDFNCDIDYRNAALLLLLGSYLQDLQLHLQLTKITVSTDCHLHSPPDCQQLGIFHPFHFGIHWPICWLRQRCQGKSLNCSISRTRLADGRRLGNS